MQERYRFGEFEFAVDSGELRRRGNGETAVERLQPQPARLLALLLQHEGEVVARETIRQRLWPDVSVDFDSNLHFCVRQVRSALEDSAAEPRYIETLPRRGYRLMVPVESGAADPGLDEIDRAQPGPGRLVAWIWVPLVLAIGISVVWIIAAGSPQPNHSATPVTPVAVSAPLRVGIMPFRSTTPTNSMNGEGIAETILESLISRAGPAVELIGPTTTTGYADDGSSLARLASEQRLDFIINGRFLSDDTGPSMLAELIRLPDGAHIWVKRYRELNDAEAIGREISDHVEREMGLGE